MNERGKVLRWQKTWLGPCRLNPAPLSLSSQPLAVSLVHSVPSLIHSPSARPEGEASGGTEGMGREPLVSLTVFPLLASSHTRLTSGSLGLPPPSRLVSAPVSHFSRLSTSLIPSGHLVRHEP